MPRKTVLALLAQADATLPDNITQDISAADVRQMIKDVIDTYRPGYAVMEHPLITIVALGLTPRVIPYASVVLVTPEYTAVPLTGAITRLAGGLPSTVNRATFACDMAASTGNEVVFTLYRDGVSIPGGTTVSGEGAGNVVQASFSVPTSNLDGADHVYDVRAIKVTGGVDDIELSNVRFIVELIPSIGV